MTEDEAKKVVNIMLKADGSCPFCAYDLVAAFIAQFPEFHDSAKEVYMDEYGEVTHWRGA